MIVKIHRGNGVVSYVEGDRDVVMANIPEDAEYEVVSGIPEVAVIDGTAIPAAPMNYNRED